MNNLDYINSKEGFNPDEFSKLYEWENNHFWFTNRNNRIIFLVKKYLIKPFNFLEIGCGTGFVIERLKKEFEESTFLGTEYYNKGLEFAIIRNPKIQFLQTDARKIPFSGEFDAIGAFDVIEHIEEDVEVFKQMNKALKNNGVIFVTVPQHKFLWSHIDEISFHKRRYTRKELLEKVQNSGFEVLDINSFTSLLLPFMIISRTFQKEKSISGSEFNISKITNFVFNLVLKLEFFLVKAGIIFPFGGSLMLVARKVL
jgi:SAM-dependent methyltransferase